MNMTPCTGEDVIQWHIIKFVGHGERLEVGSQWPS